MRVGASLDLRASKRHEDHAAVGVEFAEAQRTASPRSMQSVVVRSGRLMVAWSDQDVALDPSMTLARSLPQTA